MVSVRRELPPSYFDKEFSLEDEQLVSIAGSIARQIGYDEGDSAEVVDDFSVVFSSKDGNSILVSLEGSYLALARTLVRLRSRGIYPAEIVATESGKHALAERGGGSFEPNLDNGPLLAVIISHFMPKGRLHEWAKGSSLSTITPGTPPEVVFGEEKLMGGEVPWSTFEHLGLERAYFVDGMTLEYRGLEVARLVQGHDRIEVGSGSFDRLVRLEQLGASYDTLQELNKATDFVKANRKVQGRNNSIRETAKARWLRWALISNPDLIGMDQVVPFEIGSFDSKSRRCYGIARRKAEQILLCITIGADPLAPYEAVIARESVIGKGGLEVGSSCAFIHPELDRFSAIENVAKGLDFAVEFCGVGSDWQSYE